MAIRIKAVERFMRFDKEGEGAYRYMLSTDVYSKLDESKVIEEASMRCGVPKGAVCQDRHQHHLL